MIHIYTYPSFESIDSFKEYISTFGYYRINLCFIFDSGMDYYNGPTAVIMRTNDVDIITFNKKTSLTNQIFIGSNHYFKLIVINNGPDIDEFSNRYKKNRNPIPLPKYLLYKRDPFPTTIYANTFKDLMKMTWASLYHTDLFNHQINESVQRLTEIFNTLCMNESLIKPYSRGPRPSHDLGRKNLILNEYTAGIITSQYCKNAPSTEELNQFHIYNILLKMRDCNIIGIGANYYKIIKDIMIIPFNSGIRPLVTKEDAKDIDNKSSKEIDYLAMFHDAVRNEIASENVKAEKDLEEKIAKLEAKLSALKKENSDLWKAATETEAKLNSIRKALS